MEHVNPIMSGVKGWVENEHGNIVAVVKLSGKITKPEEE